MYTNKMYFTTQQFIFFILPTQIFLNSTPFLSIIHLYPYYKIYNRERNRKRGRERNRDYPNPYGPAHPTENLNLQSLPISSSSPILDSSTLLKPRKIKSRKIKTLGRQKNQNPLLVLHSPPSPPESFVAVLQGGRTRENEGVVGRREKKNNSILIVCS